MYLSRLILNPRSRRVQKEIEYAYELHRTLMRGFPQNHNRFSQFSSPERMTWLTQEFWKI